MNIPTWVKVALGLAVGYLIYTKLKTMKTAIASTVVAPQVATSQIEVTKTGVSETIQDAVYALPGDVIFDYGDEFNP